MAHTGGRVQEQRKERARLVHRARDRIQDVLPLGAVCHDYLLTSSGPILYTKFLLQVSLKGLHLF